MKKQNLFSRNPEMFGASWSEVTSGERNEIVFERLNKTYGAYEIRTNYDNTLLKAFSATGLLIVLLSAIYFITNAIPALEIEIPKSDVVLIQPLITTDNPIIPKTETFIKPASASTDNLKPEVTDNNKDIDNKIIPENPNNNSGTGNPLDTGSSEPFTIIPSGGGEKEIEQPPFLESTAVQELPEFPGGEEERQRFLHNNVHIPQAIIELGSIKEKVGISFVVRKDGNISDVEVFKGGSKYYQLNNEALRVIKKMPAWKPGRQNGAPVNVRMIMPIQFIVK